MLAVDIGNTHTVFGLFRDGTLLRKWRLATRANATSDEVEMRVRGLLEIASFTLEDVHAAAIATVVPSLERSWRKAVERIVPSEQVWTLTYADCGFPLDYPDPSQIGPVGLQRSGMDGDGWAVGPHGGAGIDGFRTARPLGGTALTRFRAVVVVLDAASPLGAFVFRGGASAQAQQVVAVLVEQRRGQELEVFQGVDVGRSVEQDASEHPFVQQLLGPEKASLQGAPSTPCQKCGDAVVVSRVHWRPI